MADDYSFISNLVTLPSPPTLFLRLTKLLADPNCDVSEIVNTLKLDPSMSSRILRLANSAFFGLSKSVVSIRNAVVILGLKKIFSLVAATQVLAPFTIKQSLPMTLESFWRHSSMVAIISESIVRHLQRYDPLDQDEVFSAALLHDIGMVILAGVQEKFFLDFYKMSSEKKIPFYKTENEKFSHTLIGYFLAKSWNFPPELQFAIRYHHDPLALPEYSRFLSIVHCADCVANLLGFTSIVDETSNDIDPDALETLGLPSERIKVIATDALEDHAKLESLMLAVGDI